MRHTFSSRVFRPRLEERSVRQPYRSEYGAAVRGRTCLRTGIRGQGTTRDRAGGSTTSVIGVPARGQRRVAYLGPGRFVWKEACAKRESLPCPVTTFTQAVPAKNDLKSVKCRASLSHLLAVLVIAEVPPVSALASPSQMCVPACG